MEWSKLKNIILLLLLMTNLCLLAFVGQREWKREQQLRDARDAAIAFLGEKNVWVEESQIPEKTGLLPQNVERNVEWEQKAASAVLGADVKTERRTGDIYRYYSDRGVLQFHGDGTFTARFQPETFPLGENWEKVCLDVLNRLGFRGTLTEERGEVKLFRQSWEDVPIFTNQAALVCQNGSLTEITGGRRLIGEPVPDSSWQPVTVATALFDFYNGLGALGDVCSRVDRIDRGYISTAGLSGRTALVPVWRIDTDTGSYQLDIMSGTLIRLS